MNLILKVFLVNETILLDCVLFEFTILMGVIAHVGSLLHVSLPPQKPLPLCVSGRRFHSLSTDSISYVMSFHYLDL